ncbi:dodecin family protein [Gelidibacter pelagius]|uniref:Dodecin domain-containing protein n=1 Tax=Gelidibacter pelagius TaxID=2819985 RepID=A0ABS3SN38_9FLAO|nr:dodecin family protein [Gelidibacter pelagius]MBO3097128.1 dodecin domain-containing protein [Gelidibacter pelagius]
MAVLKVIEILSSSDKSWEDATKNGVTHASKTIKNIKSVYVKDQSVTVKNNELAQYRVNLKITFEVN